MPGFGLKPFGVRRPDDVEAFVVPASDGTALFLHDAIIVNGTSDATSGRPQAIRATAGATNRITGVVVGFENDGNPAAAIYRVASTLRTVRAIVHKAQRYAVVSAGTIAATDVSARGNLDHSTAGSAYTGLSGAVMNATEAATATFQLRIHRLISGPGLDIAAAGNVAEVSINIPVDSDDSAGV